MSSPVLYNCRNLIYTNFRRRNAIGCCTTNNMRIFTRCGLPQLHSQNVTNRDRTTLRCFSTEASPNAEPAESTYKPLMDIPRAAWPKFFNSIACWFTFSLGFPALDQEFDKYEFFDGAKQAVCVVSDALSREDYKSLEGLVTPEAIEVLRKNISAMTDNEKKELALDPKDFFFCFPWTIGMQETTEPPSRNVEIMMVFHFLRNWEDPIIPARKMGPDANVQELEAQLLPMYRQVITNPKYIDHTIVGNYRFVRNYGSSDTSWSINAINHFKLCHAEE